MDKKSHLAKKKNTKLQTAVSLSSNSIIMIAIKMLGEAEDLSIFKRKFLCPDYNILGDRSRDARCVSKKAIDINKNPKVK